MTQAERDALAVWFGRWEREVHPVAIDELRQALGLNTPDEDTEDNPSEG